MLIFKFIVCRVVIVNFHGSHYNPGCEVSCAVIINDIISCNNTITDISIQKNCAVTIIRNRIVSDCEILVFTHHNQSLIKSIGNGTVFDCKFAKAGNIIVRQRGTVHNPGLNVGIGRDHTLFALIDGKVVFRKKQDNKSYVSIEAIAE